jgi:hypothetical protein
MFAPNVLFLFPVDVLEWVTTRTQSRRATPAHITRQYRYDTAMRSPHLLRVEKAAAGLSHLSLMTESS